MIRVHLTRSPMLSKKYRVRFVDEKRHVDFGARGYSDYTIHKDDDRRALYIKRHRVHENWKDVYTAGFWARWLLWEKKTIKEAKADMSKRFGIRFLP